MYSCVSIFRTRSVLVSREVEDHVQIYDNWYTWVCPSQIRLSEFLLAARARAVQAYSSVINVVRINRSYLYSLISLG